MRDGKVNMGPEGWQTLCQIGIMASLVLSAICGYGAWHFGKQVDKNKSAMPSDKATAPQISQNHNGSGDNVAGDKHEHHHHHGTSQPALKTIQETHTDHPNGTHVLSRTVEMNAPYAGRLTVTITATGLIRASVEEAPRQTALPDGNIMTTTGGGISYANTETKDYFTTTISAPTGRYNVIVVTQRQTTVNIQTVFQ